MSEHKDAAAASTTGDSSNGTDGEFVACLSAKEIKKLAKPEFAANPDKFYPTGTLKKLGFHRASCPICGNNFWRHTEKRINCGDSQCEKKYTFIGVGTGKGRDQPNKPGEKITYAGAWEGFKRSLSSARVPCTPIARYPVVARSVATLTRTQTAHALPGFFSGACLLFRLFPSLLLRCSDDYDWPKKPLLTPRQKALRMEFQHLIIHRI